MGCAASAGCLSDGGNRSEFQCMVNSEGIIPFHQHLVSRPAFAVPRGLTDYKKFVLAVTCQPGC
jgi:hypothetical protein